MVARVTGKAMRIRGRDTTWRTRRRAWLFGFAPESVNSLGGPNITSGEPYRVYDVWPGGTPIPRGEHETTRCLTWTDKAFTHFLTIERTIEDLEDIARAMGPWAVLRQWSFWLEPVRDGDIYRCAYAMRPGSTMAEVMVLRDRLARKSRGVFVMTTKAHNLKAIRDDIYANL